GVIGGAVDHRAERRLFETHPHAAGSVHASRGGAEQFREGIAKAAVRLVAVIVDGIVDAAAAAQCGERASQPAAATVRLEAHAKTILEIAAYARGLDAHGADLGVGNALAGVLIHARKQGFDPFRRGTRNRERTAALARAVARKHRVLGAGI